MRRKLLGSFELDDQLGRTIDETGLLDLCFAEAFPDARVLSDDGNRPARSLGCSCRTMSTERATSSRFGTIEIENDGSQIAVSLIF